MSMRPYDPTRDQDAVHRIWEETGWIDRGNKSHAAAMDSFLGRSTSLVAEVNGCAESLVNYHGGDLKYLQETLPLSAITAVTSSFVARKLGHASQLTAMAVAEAARAGQAVSALGMFEQGYYSRLGFGTGPYERRARINPARLLVANPERPPERLTKDDYQDAHRAMVSRWRAHGGVNLHQDALVQAEMGLTDDPAGLGYRDKEGHLTHFFWGSSKGEHGPFTVSLLAYQNRQQLLELLGVMRSLGDQLYVLKLIEPAHLQIQDLLVEPFRGQQKTLGGKFAESIRAEAYWQLRIIDLEACLAKTRLPMADTLGFNLTLSDPITEFLDENSDWRGIGGDYTVHLGKQSSVSNGHSAGLPLLQASVGGFSRLWLGCANASAIALSGELEADDALLARLDHELCLPQPRVGWEF